MTYHIAKISTEGRKIVIFNGNNSVIWADRLVGKIYELPHDSYAEGYHTFMKVCLKEFSGTGAFDYKGQIKYHLNCIEANLGKAKPNIKDASLIKGSLFTQEIGVDVISESLMEEYGASYWANQMEKLLDKSVVYQDREAENDGAFRFKLYEGETRKSVTRKGDYEISVSQNTIVKANLLEMTIINAVMQGYSFKVVNETGWHTRNNLNNIAAFLDATRGLDEVVVEFMKDKKFAAQLYAVWGNDFEELICDYHVNFEPLVITSKLEWKNNG